MSNINSFNKDSLSKLQLLLNTLAIQINYFKIQGFSDENLNFIYIGLPDNFKSFILLMNSNFRDEPINKLDKNEIKEFDPIEKGEIIEKFKILSRIHDQTKNLAELIGY
ncbi:hypothetical protein [Marivirga arenosa]|uniref:Uncharacterized protein n=1 Tax=Marivirga arenosa TaxID=3059076 RepID=A0AA49GGT3_9BACT|nr:hypothetical protein [Marivirga sp. BKB1-2]WKK81096.2 hypothetical protein QYS47_01515 [Marivirga sp. BKB1-2]